MKHTECLTSPRKYMLVENVNTNPAQSHYEGRSFARLCFHPRHLGLYLALLCLVLVFQSHVYAQLVGSGLDGTVTDSSGAVVQGANVKLLDTETGGKYATLTDHAGHFHFTDIRVGGPYTVTISHAGFKTEVRSGIMLVLNQTGRVDVALQVGAQSETTNVVANVSLLKTTNDTLGTNIDRTEIDNLPNLSRNVYSNMFLATGTTGGTGGSYNSFDLSVDGGRPASADILIDGIPSAPSLSNPINGFAVFPTLLGIDQVQMMTSNYDADYGRSGGGIVNMIYKSGTNQYHGNAFEYYQNSAMDANTYFGNLHNQPLAPFHQNWFGGDVGGPVWIPKLYNGRNKTFFFVSYEEHLSPGSANFLTTVPTVAERSGDFSSDLDAQGNLITIYDPTTTTTTPNAQGQFTRQAFPGNIIPQSRINPIALKAMQYMPLPNTTTPGSVPNINNYFHTEPTQNTTKTLDMKFDQNLGVKNHFFVRYSHQSNVAPEVYQFPVADQPGEGGQTHNQISNSVSVDDTYMISPKDVLEGRYGFSKISLGFIANNQFYNAAQGLGLPASEFSQPNVFPTFSIAGYVGLGDAGPNVTRVDFYETSIYALTNTMTLGNNVLKFGGEFRYLQTGQTNSAAPNFVFNFARELTQGPNPDVATINAGDGFATFLLGLANGTETTPLGSNTDDSQYIGLFIQDDWNPTRRLTLNMGLRYDLDLPMLEKLNAFTIFDPNALQNQLSSETGLPNLVGGLIYPNVNGVPRRIDSPQFLNFDPRFGFAYQLTQKIVIRGGYGIFYGASYHAAHANEGSQGFSATTNYVASQNNLTPTTYIDNPFPTGLNQVTGSSAGLLTALGQGLVESEMGDNQVPYNENWNLDIQRVLPWNSVISVAYVGSHGIHLNKGGSGNWNADQLTSADLALGTKLQQEVPNPFYGVIQNGTESLPTIAERYLVAPFPQYTYVGYLFPTGGYEDYQSIQVKIEKQLSHGLTGTLAYTYQKQIDDYSNIINDGGSAGIQNIYNDNGERSISANLTPQDLTIAADYTLPFGHGEHWGGNWNWLVNGFLGGWMVNVIDTDQSGGEIGINTDNTADAGNNEERPNLTGTSYKMPGSVFARLNGYFNPAAFSQPAPFTFGNAPRILGNYRGPAYYNIDAAINKNFYVTSKDSIMFRATANNVLNQVIWGFPNTNFTSPDFGHITNQGNGPRNMQIGLQFNF